MAEDTHDVNVRPFQLRPSILSGGSGFGSMFGGSGGLADGSNKGFMLRPSALSSATEKLEAQPKSETRKRSFNENDVPEKEVENESAKKSKITEEDSPKITKTPTLKLTEDLEKPKGIGTFGFDQNNESNIHSNENDSNDKKSFPNYFAQNTDDKISFVFGTNTNTSTVGFSTLNQENTDNDKNLESVENGHDESEKPISENDNNKLLENANEYQKVHDEKKLHFEEIETITGEEGEKHVLQIFCKLHLFDKEKKSWLEKGRGTLKLNDICQSEGVFQSRLVFRTQGTNLVQLNTMLWPEMCCEKVKEKNIRITGIDPDTKESKVYLISTNMKDCLQTFTAIDRRIEALKRNRGNQREQQKESATNDDGSNDSLNTSTADQQNDDSEEISEANEINTKTEDAADTSDSVTTDS